MKIAKTAKIAIMKILLLFVVLLGATVGVVAYRWSRVTPPREPEGTNTDPFTKAIREDIGKTDSMNSLNDLDDLYLTVTHEISFADNNGLIDSKQSLLDDFNSVFAPHYLPLFKEKCERMFNRTWHEAELDLMRSKVEKLERTFPKYQSDLKDVVYKIKTCSSAQEVARASGFTSPSITISTIKRASNYRGTAYISNCPELRNRLASVGPRLKTAHYNYVSNKISSLRNYINSEDKEFRSKYKEVESAIDTYARQSYANDANSLRSKLNSVINDYNEVYH